MMRFGEAVRLGAMLRGQCCGALLKEYWEATPDTPVFYSCAIGAALEAVGLITPTFNISTDSLRRDWPAEWKWMQRNVRTACPAGGCGLPLPDAALAIVHLNDIHGWTRERIADWVDSIDPTPHSTEPNHLAGKMVCTDELVAA